MNTQDELLVVRLSIENIAKQLQVATMAHFDKVKIEAVAKIEQAVKDFDFESLINKEIEGIVRAELATIVRREAWQTVQEIKKEVTNRVVAHNIRSMLRKLKDEEVKRLLRDEFDIYE